MNLVTQTDSNAQTAVGARMIPAFGDKKMRINLAVFLDENVQQGGGELQITRRKNVVGCGSVWELIVWQPVPGSRYPCAAVRVRAKTAIGLLDELETWLQNQMQRCHDDQPTVPRATVPHPPRHIAPSQLSIGLTTQSN